MIQEQRRDYRHYEFVRVICTFENGSKLEVQTRNISKNGVFLSIMNNYHKAEADEMIHLQLYKDGVIKHAIGKIVRIDSHGLAIKFIENRDKDRVVDSKPVRCLFNDQKELLLKTRDLSTTGVFIVIDKNKHTENINNEISVSIYDSGETHSKIGTVVRVEDEGIALTFVRDVEEKDIDI